jgi:cell division protease FtsH
LKTNSSKQRNILLIVILCVLALLLVYVSVNQTNSKEISLTELKEKVNNDEIVEIYTTGGVGKILKSGSSISEDQFPSSYDYYFSYTSGTISYVSDLIDTYNSKVEEYNADVSHTTKKALIKFTDVPTSPSIIETIMPYIYVVMICVIGFVVYKMMTGGGTKTNNFGKSKAKVTENIKVRFSDVAGVEEEKAELQEIVEFLKNPQKFRDVGARIPKGVLLVGPPGTGKTLLAKAIAGESNVPFFSMSGSDFVELFVGVGASRVRDLFEQAKRNMPCIVFIDEIDAVGRQRGTGLGGGNDEREQTLNQLLVQMDGFEENDGIIVIAATNRADILDPALTRPGRFDRQIFVYPPDVKGREKIIEVHAKNKPMDKNVDFKVLARLTSGFTGADIENLLNEAAIATARDNRTKITMTDITEAINKVLMGPQKKSRVITPSDKRITAYHESGHTIVAKMLPNCDAVQEVSVISRGMAAGYTLTRDDSDDMHMSKNKLNDMISMMMGGRVAEELVIQDFTTGASNDIQKATNLARKMVTEWGMGSLGCMSFSSEDQVFIGRDYQTKNNYSEKVAGMIDEETKKILDENYARAKKILIEKRSILDEMAKLLLEKETIYADEVNMLIAGKTADEISAIMDKKDADEKIKQELDKKAYEIEKQKRAIEAKVKTAETLYKAGIIGIKELNQIKEESEKNMKMVDEDNNNSSNSENSSTSNDTNDSSNTQNSDELNDNASQNLKEKDESKNDETSTIEPKPNKDDKDNKDNK